MNIETAPSATDGVDEEPTCGVCGAEGSFVLYDRDKVCIECGHAPDGGESLDAHNSGDRWVEWWQHRAANYDGFYGDGRIKMVGGFGSAYP